MRNVRCRGIGIKSNVEFAIWIKTLGAATRIVAKLWIDFREVLHYISALVNAPVSSAEEDTNALVLAAIGQGGSVTGMLKSLAERLSAFGCVLWEAASGARLDLSTPRGHLYTLASSFRTDEVFAYDALDLASSATGKAILIQTP
jgi:hypothetical protein